MQGRRPRLQVSSRLAQSPFCGWGCMIPAQPPPPGRHAAGENDPLTGAGRHFIGNGTPGNPPDDSLVHVDQRHSAAACAGAARPRPRRLRAADHGHAAGVHGAAVAQPRHADTDRDSRCRECAACRGSATERTAGIASGRWTTATVRRCRPARDCAGRFVAGDRRQSLLDRRLGRHISFGRSTHVVGQWKRDPAACAYPGPAAGG